MAQGQNPEIDRLLGRCEETRYTAPDSTLFYGFEALGKSRSEKYSYGISKAFFYIGDGYLSLAEFTKSLDYLDSAILSAESNGIHNVEADSYNLKGIIFSDLGEYDKSIELYLKGKELGQKNGYERAIMVSDSNIGVSYYLKGDYAKSLEYFIETQKYFLESGDTLNYLVCTGNIVSIYNESGQLDKGLELTNDALNISVGNPAYIDMHAELLSQKGLLLASMSKPNKAMEFYMQAMQIFVDIGDYRSVARIYNNIAAIYQSMHKLEDAIRMGERAIEISDSLGYENDIAFYSKSLAIFLAEEGKYAKAEGYCFRSIEISRKINAVDYLLDGYNLMAEIYAGQGAYKDAYSYQQMYLTLKDSIDLSESQTKLQEMTVLHQLDKRELENEKLKEENERKKVENELKDERLARNRIGLVFMTIGILLVLVLAIFIFRAYKNQKKSRELIDQQKKEIESQHIILEETHQELTDSIQYAKRLQEAILPSAQVILEGFRNHFVLYMPKDIVAGDFYWFEEKDEYRFLAAADCTGHGVPGAMVSVVCHNALNRSVREFDLSDPGLILDKVTELVVETFEKSDQEVKDGMDIGLLSYHIPSGTFSFSGANNSLYIIRNSELIEIKADKQPVGVFEGRTAFTAHDLDLQTGDLLVLYSDGYADQFGGDKGKKMKSKAFKELLLEHSSKELREINQTLQTTFNNWKGDYEQVDDVCVIGVRV